MNVVYQRGRLLDVLGQALHAAAVWIEALPGAGKTTLAASWIGHTNCPCLWYQVDAGDADPATFFHYLGLAAKHIAPRYRQALPHLTPEYLFGFETFTRRFFEELYQRMPEGCVLVFDNFQDAGIESPLGNILRIAIEALPSHVKLLCISRKPAPVALARLRANGQLVLLAPADIRLTLEEAEGIASLRGCSDHAAVATIHTLTHGWAAGLVLMLESKAMDATDIQGSQALFNYFASEVLREMDEAKRQTLLKSALLPKMRVSDVETLTGYVDAGKLLSELQQHNYFTYCLSPGDPVYEFHPLFREFLRQRLYETFERNALVYLQSEAGRLLDESGQIEAAAALWIEADNWTVLVPHVLKHSPRLLAEGRAHVVQSWLAKLPAELAEANSWLQYWTGACRIAFDPARARGYFERAFELFEAEHDLAGQCESWANIVDTFNFEWGGFKPLDHWIAAMDGILEKYPDLPSPEIEVRVAAGMLTALTNRRPDRPDIAVWAERVEKAVLTSGDIQFRIMLGNALLLYYLWIGDFSKTIVVIDALRPSTGTGNYSPLARQMWYVMKSMHAWIVADLASCRMAIEEGLRNAKETGVHLLDFYLLAQGVYGGLSLGDPRTAVECLEKMAAINSPRLGDRALYHYEAASVAWHHGDLVRAAEHGRQAVNITGEMGWHISHVLSLSDLAVTLFDDGRRDEADECIEQALAASSGMPGLEFPACMNGVLFALERGQEERARALLERGLSLGKRYGFLNMPRWNNDRMSRFLAKALEFGIESDYTLKIIRKRNLLPPQEGEVPERWPRSVRVETLGRFALMKDGQPMQVEGKVQKRALDLLKMIIALGSVEVGEQRLCDALWPASEADDARASLKVTLHRLRGLVGHEVLVLRGSKLSLNLRHCRVDVVEFERIASRLIVAQGNLPAAELARAGEAMVELYRGPFLHDEDSVFALSARERLRTKWLRALGVLAEGLRRHGACEEALAWYERGLEADPLAEPFYQGLMRVLLSLRRFAEGMDVYERCRKALALQLQIVPSPETDALALMLRSSCP